MPRFAVLVTAIVVTLLIIGALAAVDAQEPEDGRRSHSMQIIVQPLADDRVEFGLYYGGEPVLPEARFLNVETAPRNRWLNSSVVTLLGPVFVGSTLFTLSEDGEYEGTSLYRSEDDAWNQTGFGRVEIRVQISVQVQHDGYLEFTIMHQGERVLPETRYLGPATREGRLGEWLASSEIEVWEDRSPASLVRELSWDVADQANIDVAQHCVLVEVEAYPSPRFYFYDRYSTPYTHPEFVDFIAAGAGANDASVDVAWLYGRNWRGAGAEPAERYMFLVRDLDALNRMVLWTAEFDCTEQVPEPEPDERLEVE